MEHFKCDMCGLCCRSVSKSDVYKHLDRGDGTCKYYEDQTHKCSIYATRPIICNVEGFYEKFLMGKINKEKFFELNYVACSKLKSEFGKE